MVSGQGPAAKFTTATPVGVTGSVALVSALNFLYSPQPWMARANCRDADPNMFFPNVTGPAQYAKRICAGCEVRTECLEYGLLEKYGIWGGTNESERRKIRRARNARKKTVA